MKTIKYKTLNDAPGEIKEKILDSYRGGNDYDYMWHGAQESLKRFLDHFGASLGNRDNIKCQDLEGIKLVKFLIREMPSKGKYYGTTSKGVTYRSKIIMDGSCPFTGVCYDETLLDEVRNFLKKPDMVTTLRDLLEWAKQALEREIDNEIEFQDSDEAIMACLEDEEIVHAIGNTVYVINEKEEK